jgi:5'-3' exoribonuclease 1
MGIPSYFSYIIRNYTNIIRKRGQCEPIHHLLMDCNSIIYDAYRELEEKYKKEPFPIETIEKRLIQRTIHKIEEYIELVKPSKTVYVTFDGVAPFAKMNQQRIRRYKSQDATTTPLWNTTAITPGTTFMTHLSQSIYSYFTPTTPSSTTYQNKYPSRKILVSCSDEPGEGEHKLFHFIRTTDCSSDVIAVYGLDADLIMLSLFHQSYSKNIYVFRESPTFKTVLSHSYEQKELLFMDIGGLINSIFQEMGNYQTIDKSLRVTDYVFMCFFLGNDFLPHFPALNIRTHGIQILTDTYYQTIGRFRDRSFIHPTTKQILWQHVYSFLEALSKQEEKYLQQEYDSRAKWDKKTWPSKTPIETEELILNSPVIYRADEHYICPHEYGWESRYYKRLIDIDPTRKNIEHVCRNYLEGLEWVYHYYTGDCIDWQWKYQNHYAPLLKDLIRYIPAKPTQLLQQKAPSPISPEKQLACVLPRSQLTLVPTHVRDVLMTKYIHLYPETCKKSWAFCRYNWEGHPILPEINILELTLDC